MYLGQRGLSIIDLSEKGHQPMQIEKGPVIVYNREIYRRMLELRDGHVHDPRRHMNPQQLLLYREALTPRNP